MTSTNYSNEECNMYCEENNNKILDDNDSSNCDNLDKTNDKRCKKCTNGCKKCPYKCKSKYKQNCYPNKCKECNKNTALYCNKLFVSTLIPSTSSPSTSGPSTLVPSTLGPSTSGPSTSGPSTSGPTTLGPYAEYTTMPYYSKDECNMYCEPIKSNDPLGNCSTANNNKLNPKCTSCPVNKECHICPLKCKDINMVSNGTVQPCYDNRCAECNSKTVSCVNPETSAPISTNQPFIIPTGSITIGTGIPTIKPSSVPSSSVNKKLSPQLIDPIHRSLRRNARTANRNNIEIYERRGLVTDSLTLDIDAYYPESYYKSNSYPEYPSNIETFLDLDQNEIIDISCKNKKNKKKLIDNDLNNYKINKLNELNELNELNGRNGKNDLQIKELDELDNYRIKDLYDLDNSRNLELDKKYSNIYNLKKEIYNLKKKNNNFLEKNKFKNTGYGLFKQTFICVSALLCILIISLLYICRN